MNFYSLLNLLEESKNSNRSTIVVDVQPEYSGIYDGDENPIFPEIINFIQNIFL